MSYHDIKLHDIYDIKFSHVMAALGVGGWGVGGWTGRVKERREEEGVVKKMRTGKM